MFRHLVRIAALVAVTGILLLGTTSAQTARRTLSQRLEQFRDDLVGEGGGDDGSQDTGLPSPAVQRTVPVRSNVSADAGPPQVQVPTLASQPKTIGDTVNGLKVQHKSGSSRRTAQPGYKPSQSQPTPAEAESSEPDEADSHSEPAPGADACQAAGALAQDRVIVVSHAAAGPQHSARRRPAREPGVAGQVGRSACEACGAFEDHRSPQERS